MSHDRRLDHRAYGKDPMLAGLKAAYEIFAVGVDAATDILKPFLHPRQQRLARLAADHLIAAASPANIFIGNAAARERALETKGKSLFDGAANFVADLLYNEGKPVPADTSSFSVGHNLALTPGVVVHREELFELLRYNPTTASVHEVPLLISPPPINRFYVLDLAPGRSFVEAAVAAGNTVYLISWRNPGAEMADVSFADYVTRGVAAALDFIAAPKVNLLGVCLGGTLAAMTTAYEAATGADRINSLSLLVTLTEFSGDTGAMGAMITPKVVDAVRAESAKKGYLSAEQMSAGFTNLKPMDLIWTPATDRWMLGDPPPVMDLLAWNADGTRLPSRMHAEYLSTLYVQDDFAAGNMIIDGYKLDMNSVKVSIYAVAAEKDHIVPWISSLVGASHFGGDRRLVLAGGGHVGCIVAPPSDRAWHIVGGDTCADAPSWLDGQEKRVGSWWGDWHEWARGVSGPQIAPPEPTDGLCAAPGTYVYG